MVAKLKSECGYQYTSKLEGMFNDVRISKDIMVGYKAHVKEIRDGREAADAGGDGKETDKVIELAPSSSSSTLANNEVELDVDVLTTGYWPSQSAPTCHLPDQVTSAIKKFESFYFVKHTGRKLAWQTSLGTAELKATFDGGRKHELIVTTYQMCILMLFNTSEKRTLKEIKIATNIPDDQLCRHLISLCTPKHRVLRKASKGRTISPDDSFTINMSFSSKLKRVKIPLVSTKEAIKDGDGDDGKEGSSIPKAVEESRKHLLEAAIVRIMKARKSLQHNDLIAEVTRQLSTRFVPDPVVIKKRIESLIEREYLERSEEDRKCYLYLA